MQVPCENPRTSLPGPSMTAIGNLKQRLTGSSCSLYSNLREIMLGFSLFTPVTPEGYLVAHVHSS
jgi:hypothetical protein